MSTKIQKIHKLLGLMDEKTLGEFIEAEIKRRNLSAREFARYVDVPSSLINKFRNHGLRETYGSKPVGDPSLDFLVKLAKATHVDICALLAITRPDAEVVDPAARILAQRITRLAPDKRQIVDTFLEGVAVRILQERQK